MTLHAVIVLAYLAFVVLVSLVVRKAAHRSATDFLIAGRNLGVIACAVVVASEWLGGMSTIGVSEKAFSTGTLQPVLYNVATATGMVIIGFTVASRYREKGVHTVSEMLESLFGPGARAVSAISFLVAYVVLSYVQLQTCASIVTSLFGLGWLQAVLISSLVITAYTYIGGMHALVVTGIIHVITMFIGIGGALIVGLDEVGGLLSLRNELVAVGSPANLYNPFSAGAGYAFSLLLGGVLGGMAGQASIQPIFAARDPRTARRAAVASSLIIAPFGVMVALLGLIARTGRFFDPATLISPKTVLPRLLTSPDFVHPVLGGLALAGILAAILSTVGPVNFAIVTIATKDIYHGIFNKSADDRKVLATARKLVLLVGVVTIPLAVYIEGAVLDAAYVSYAIRAVGAIVIVLGIYARGWITPLGVKLAFIGGTTAIFVSLVAGRMGWFAFDKTFAAVASALVFVMVGNLWKVIRRNGA